MFGPSARRPRLNTGHYQVGSAGDIDARGWGVSIETALGGRTRATVDYRQANATWTRGFRRQHPVPLSVTAWPTASRTCPRRCRASCRWSKRGCSWCTTSTRRPRLADESAAGGGRFEIQVNQSLPFLAFTSAQWEALVAVRNMFYDAGGARRSTTRCSSCARRRGFWEV